MVWEVQVQPRFPEAHPSTLMVFPLGLYQRSKLIDLIAQYPTALMMIAGMDDLYFFLFVLCLDPALQPHYFLPGSSGITVLIPFRITDVLSAISWSHVETIPLGKRSKKKRHTK